MRCSTVCSYVMSQLKVSVIQEVTKMSQETQYLQNCDGQVLVHSPTAGPHPLQTPVHTHTHKHSVKINFVLKGTHEHFESQHILTQPEWFLTPFSLYVCICTCV